MVDKNLEKTLQKFMKCNYCKSYLYTFVSYNTAYKIEFNCLKCKRRWK